MFDVFMELDPLGTGRVKPYVDKKDFFSDLKNPPKQVLNDLVPRELGDYENDRSREKNASLSFDPMADPFNKIDPFETESPAVNFEDAFSDFPSFDPPQPHAVKPQLFGANMGPLQVTLPPENRTPVGSPSLSKNRKLRSKPRPSRPADENRNSPVMEGVYLRSTPPPEPPPRPAITCYSIKPPPLPPKKQSPSPSIMPRPGSRHSEYDYSHNYESLPPAPSEAPPLPVPVRKPKLSAEYDSSYVPQRPKKTSVSSCIETEYYLTPNNFNSTNLVNKTSLDMTLSQLTKTGFSELATALNLSPSSLSKLTIGELTEYMASLSKEDQRTTCDAIKDDAVRRQSNAFAEEGASFEADFEGKFSYEPSLYDKYSVFRELVQEKPEPIEQPERNIKYSPVNHIQETEDKYAALRDICIEREELGHGSDKDSNTEDVKREGYKTLDDENSYMQLNNVKFQTDDKDESPGEDVDIKFTSFNGDDQNIVSDKEEDSVAEELQVKEEDEEDRDLLDVSRPQSYSESTESPTTIFKEPQCIIESTIAEEDIENVSPLENDKRKREFVEPSEKEFGVQSVDKTDNTSWACFDEAVPVQTSLLTKEIISPSPWSATEDASSTGNEPVYKAPSVKSGKPKKTRNHESKWGEAEKEMDRDRKRDLGKYRERGRPCEWDENGHSWSDEEENDDEDDDNYVPQYTRERKYYDHKRERRRKTSPWPKSSRDPSPWQEIEPELPSWEAAGRTKTKVRGVSVTMEEERKELRKKGTSPWSIDTSWDEKERYQRTRKQSEERRRSRHRDESEHARRERSWKSSRYHRESKESPWDEEYVESDEMSPRPTRHWKPSSKKYQESYDSEEDMYVKKHYGNRGMPYGEPDDKLERYNKKYYNEDRRRRRYSQDEAEDEGSCYSNRRKPMYSGDVSEEEKPFRRKPYSHDELSGSDIEAHYTRRSQTLHFSKPRAKQRRSSKSSPFEDDFIPSSSGSHFEFPDVKSKKSGGSSSQPSPDIKPRSCDPKCCLNSSPLETSGFKRASPFEDDFTPARSDTRRTSARSGTSSYSEGESVFVGAESKVFPEERVESQMKKSESINIFKQEDDPFEDDEFFQNGGGGGDSKHLGEDETLHKWKRAFDSFNFENGASDGK